MLLAEVDDAGWLVHVSSDVPDVEVLSRVHYKELTQTIHEA